MKVAGIIILVIIFQMKFICDGKFIDGFWMLGMGSGKKTLTTPLTDGLPAISELTTVLRNGFKQGKLFGLDPGITISSVVKIAGTIDVFQRIIAEKWDEEIEKINRRSESKKGDSKSSLKHSNQARNGSRRPRSGKASEVKRESRGRSRQKRQLSRIGRSISRSFGRAISRSVSRIRRAFSKGYLRITPMRAFDILKESIKEIFDGFTKSLQRVNYGKRGGSGMFSDVMEKLRTIRKREEINFLNEISGYDVYSKIKKDVKKLTSEIASFIEKDRSKDRPSLDEAHLAAEIVILVGRYIVRSGDNPSGPRLVHVDWS